MLSVRPKITDLSFYVYGRSIHPELFEACVSRYVERDNYLLKLNITTAGHLVSFHHGSLVMSEVSASAHHPLPSKRRLISHPIEGICQDKTLFRDAVSYECRVQLEVVNPKAFLVIQQQLDQERECEGLIHRFESSGRLALGAVSYINVQSFRSHVKLRCFHTFPDTCSVVKSESSFVIVRSNIAA